MPTCYMRKHELVKHESKAEATLENLYLYWDTLNIIKEVSFISEISHNLYFTYQSLEIQFLFHFFWDSITNLIIQKLYK